MADKFSKETRSKIMSSIHGKNTKPEVIIRKILWSGGERYRIHNIAVFGKPDITIMKRKLVIFIDGCFWHGCEKCYKEPKSNISFWRKKIITNKNRRIEVRKELKSSGWNVLEFWEHEINKNPNLVVQKILEIQPQ